MANPFAYDPGRRVVRIATVFGVPLGVQGFNWLPANEVIAWGIFTWLSMRKRPAWAAWRHGLLGGLKMAVVLGSEWCHNLAHAVAARCVGRPVDAMRILFGMPVLLYNEPEHPSITPHQHILRSAAGPACNALLLAVSLLLKRFTHADSPAREVADAAAVMNTFLTTGSLLPVPVFDGGPILKWSLVLGGVVPGRTQAITERVNLGVGGALAAASAVTAARRHWLAAGILAALGLLAVAAGLGKLRDL